MRAVSQHLPVIAEPESRVLAPPQTKGRASVVKLDRAWFIACMSKELRHKPIARTIQGVPLAIFRDKNGAPGALLDRCPHRNVPLSLGEVASDVPAEGARATGDDHGAGRLPLGASRGTRGPDDTPAENTGGAHGNLVLG